MADALEDYLESSRREGLHERREDNMKPTGWYSIEVLAHAINTTSMRRKGRIEYVIELKALYLHPELIHTSSGAIVNIENKHWVAVRSIAGQIWLLDSLYSPSRMTEAQYLSFVTLRKAAYPITLAINMAASSTSRSSLDDVNSPVLPTMQDTLGTDSMTDTAEDSKIVVSEDTEMTPAESRKFISIVAKLSRTNSR